MQPRGALLALLVLALITAGCTSPGSDADDDTNTTQTTGPTNGTGSPTSIPTTDPPRGDEVVPPKQQKVDDPADVDRPGEYAILPRAADHKDKTWSVPAWSTGDTWRYEHEVPAYAALRVQTEDKVKGSGTTWETGVYRVTRTEMDCGGEGKTCVKQLNHTKADLLELKEDGYIEHSFVFPMQDGKRWIYARPDGRGGITKVTAEARHVSDYLWPGTTKTVEAWRIVLDYDTEQEVQEKWWIGVDQKNYLRHEIWGEDENGISIMYFSTTLKSYTSG